jgi:hypothetical protein
LTGHSLAETYSVLTRLSGDARVAPPDAVSLLDANFDRPVLPSEDTTISLPAELATRGVAGGAVYDALVGLAARDARLRLVTVTEGRPRPTLPWGWTSSFFPPDLVRPIWVTQGGRSVVSIHLLM